MKFQDLAFITYHNKIKKFNQKKEVMFLLAKLNLLRFKKLNPMFLAQVLILWISKKVFKQKIKMQEKQAKVLKP
jgi:hypothetical protein